MKKLIYLIVAIVALSLIIAGCGIPVVPPTEQSNIGNLTKATTINVPADYGTIQAAIDAATGGDTINVAAGTYTPSSTIIINKNNLTLNGPQANVDPRPSYSSTRIAGSALEAVIDGGPNTLGIIIFIGADNVVINGFEIKSGKGDMISQGQGYDPTAHSGTVVKYNIIHDGRGDEGVQLKKCTNGVLEYNYVFEIADAGDALNIADNSSHGAIRYNEVCGIHGENAAIYIYGSEHMEIIGNLVRDSGIGGNDGIKVGAKGTGDATKKYVLVKDNIIHDITQDGISVYMSDVTVEGNEIYNCHSENGAIYLAYTINNIDIHDNDIYNNTLKTTKRLTSAGILLEYRVNATSVTVHNNNIYNNTPYGITNEATALLDATCNWWGDAIGPSGEGTGTGDVVSTKVYFDPWLSGPAPDGFCGVAPPDTTPPEGSITINSDATYTNSTSVTLNLSATDEVGVTRYRIANGNDASGGTTVAITNTTSFSDNISWTLLTGDGTKTVAVQYGDAAGNWSTNYTDSIILDTTPPVVTITVPAEGAAYTLGQTVLANWTATDAESGIASATGTVPSGLQIDTGTVGTKPFKVTATDNAGNETVKTVKYYVIYNFSGFFRPVDNPDVVNLVKAGSAIPVKFSLSGYQGLNIFATADYPKSVKIVCDTGAPTDEIESTVTAGGSSLSYDAATDQYIYVWKTAKDWVGCRRLEVKLNDGFTHIAYFKFKK